MEPPSVKALGIASPKVAAIFLSVLIIICFAMPEFALPCAKLGVFRLLICVLATFIEMKIGFLQALITATAVRVSWLNVIEI